MRDRTDWDGCAGLSETAYGLIMLELERADSGLRSLAAHLGFWALLERRWPRYREDRAWLRHHGATLVL